MRKFQSVFVCMFFVINICSQTITQKLQRSFTGFEKDTQLAHAISSLYVIDANTGKVVFDKNSRIGLAPASTQKIITSVTAFELMGKDYRYKTELGYDGAIINNSIEGNLIVIANGDPTLGSWRWESTKPEKIIKSFVKALQQKGIKSVRDSYILGITHFEDQYLPDYWIWQDVGNYYGAGCVALNWKENQFDIYLNSPYELGGLVEVDTVKTKINFYEIRSEVRSAAAGTGDNAYAYLPSGNSKQIVLRGTIPLFEKGFKISASIPDPTNDFFKTFQDSLSQNKIELKFNRGKSALFWEPAKIKKELNAKSIFSHFSPSLDSIIYWFNKKSINLYGEALLKTIAFEKMGYGSTDSGVSQVKKFWKEKGIAENELNIFDGSGLSPLNRVTTHAQVEILRYAKTKGWFPYFYNSLPEYNGMKIKSGTIRDVKGFCGYHKSKDGKEYIFSFLVNNYNGSATLLVQKMYKVLDVLK